MKLQDFEGLQGPFFPLLPYLVFEKRSPGCQGYFFGRKKSVLISRLLISLDSSLLSNFARNLYDTFYPTYIKVSREAEAACLFSSSFLLSTAQAFRHVFGYCFFEKISKRKMLVAVLALSWLRAEQERERERLLSRKHVRYAILY